MAYASEQDLVERFGANELIRLTNPDDLQATSIDSNRLARAIADAEAMVDGYLQGPYDVPLSPVPRVITKLAADLARHELHDDQPPEHVIDQKNDALKFLRSVAKGEIALGTTAFGATVARDDQVAIESGGRTFGRGGQGQGFIG